MSNDLCFNGTYLRNDLYRSYHQKEWGKPIYDNNKLFEALCLEIFQSGLSWLTILNKRQNLRGAFCNFDIKTVSSFDENHVIDLLKNPNIIRHKKKIESVIQNAEIIYKSSISFSEIVWSFFDNKIIDNYFKNCTDIPSQDLFSNSFSQYLKALGFVFIGPKLCYSFMEACGIYNNHIATCLER